jgi:two-component system CheB/CheR fusion protein
MRLVVDAAGLPDIDAREERRIVVQRTRILLVDDYPDALEMWGLYLRSLGYDVATADNGLTALEIALALPPDVIVMDLELPGITGFEAARRLRQHAPTARVPLIAATGYSHVRQLEQARSAGFDSIIVKPCDPKALVAEIERCRRGTATPVIGEGVERVVNAHTHTR